MPTITKQGITDILDLFGVEIPMVDTALAYIEKFGLFSFLKKTTAENNIVGGDLTHRFIDQEMPDLGEF